MLTGIDLSSHQDPAAVPWTKMSHGFMYARTSFGLGVDPTFQKHVLRAREAGVPLCGGYHALRPARPVVGQVDLIDKALDLVGGQVFPVVDCEIIDGMTPRQVADRCLEFCERLESRRGVRVTFYSYYYFAKTLPLDPSFAARPLIVARYGGTPLIPAPWTGATIHQYDGTGGERAPGGLDCDFNRTPLTAEQLRSALFQRIEPS